MLVSRKGAFFVVMYKSHCYSSILRSCVNKLEQKKSKNIFSPKYVHLEAAHGMWIKHSYTYKNIVKYISGIN